MTCGRAAGCRSTAVLFELPRYGSGFAGGAQGCEESFELFAAFSAQVEVFLDQRHGLGGVEAG
jgi:hypothetical protein